MRCSTSTLFTIIATFLFQPPSLSILLVILFGGGFRYENSADAYSITLMQAHAAALSMKSAHKRESPSTSSLLLAKGKGGKCDDDRKVSPVVARRQWIHSTAAIAASCVTTFLLSLPGQAKVIQAVGSAERQCQLQNNCLQIGDLDGAIHWHWGGKNRCDASDPQCSSGGIMLDSIPGGANVPLLDGHEITHVIELDLLIGSGGRGRELQMVKFGLYGKDCPLLVQQMIQFCDKQKGLVTIDPQIVNNSIGSSIIPVIISSGGILNSIQPNERLVFGIPSQAEAYARSLGRSSAGDNFIPQPRTDKTMTETEQSARLHTVAGLISFPPGGLGNNNNGGGRLGRSDDEAYANAFQITAAATPTMDSRREGRKVIGQILDKESMGAIARLASLPIKKGLKGVLPGQSSGPPLLKVIISDSRVYEMGREPAPSAAL